MVTKDAFIALQAPVRVTQVLWLVCLCISVSVSPRGYLRNYTCDLYQILVHAAYGRGSIFLRRRRRSLLSTIALFVKMMRQTFSKKEMLVGKDKEAKEIQQLLWLRLYCGHFIKKIPMMWDTACFKFTELSHNNAVHNTISTFEVRLYSVLNFVFRMNNKKWYNEVNCLKKLLLFSFRASGPIRPSPIKIPKFSDGVQY